MYHVPNNVECRHYQKVRGGKATCPRTRTVHPGQCFLSQTTQEDKKISSIIYILFYYS